MKIAAISIVDGPVYRTLCVSYCVLGWDSRSFLFNRTEKLKSALWFSF